MASRPTPSEVLDRDGHDQGPGGWSRKQDRASLQPFLQGPQAFCREGEIDCDEYGRILVRFHWDLADAYSMRCRVSQSWAGKGWGGMVIPRIGMEVVVEFLEGDPDKPLVTGCVYNGKNEVPYELPKHKTRSTFKSDTHQGRGFNELRFEDEKGREEIFVHAQLDHNTKVLNHQTTRVDRTKVESIGAASLREVRLVDVHNVGMDMTFNVGTGPHGSFVRAPLTGNSQGIRVAAYNFEKSFPDLSGKGNFTVNATSTIALSAGANWSQNVDGQASMTYGRNLSQTVRDNVRENTGKDHSHVVGAKYRLDAHEEIHLRSGAAEIRLKADGTIIINGKDLTAMLSGDTSVTSGGKIGLKGQRIDLN
ncbi:type VI secretion system tip protein TssI/VgrG [Vannielia litorea]|uniref:Rhs element Vgr protein n=1 Tax=Vannielia litorea TaxID=1217970 RepID=A0A1N6IG37_9RHOB|nr:type VI secretion system tip protein TssI/VgrG [Vannielia litorea]SIO30987.1 Rhs element Vgr protein [Vannielia litorea]